MIALLLHDFALFFPLSLLRSQPDQPWTHVEAENKTQIVATTKSQTHTTVCRQGIRIHRWENCKEFCGLISL